MTATTTQPTGAVVPSEDGALLGDAATELALSGPRLLARADRQGVHDVFVWGGGRIGGVRLDATLPDAARAVVEPGRLHFR